jgi:hypothetical protein
LPTTITHDGIKIDFKPLPLNEDSSIRSNRLPFSNLTDSSDLHPWKLDLPTTTTDDGIKIDFKPLPLNEDSPIRSNPLPFSNVTDSSDLHP